MLKYLSLARLALVSLGAALTTPASAHNQNLVAGTWRIVSAVADPQGVGRPLYGAHPSGQLIFTEDLHFTVVINNTEVPRFASDNRAEGTAAEDKAAMTGALALYGTYTVNEAGHFASEHVIGCTFPNWNGLARDTGTLTETVEGDRMIEHLHDPGGPLIEIVWERAR